MAAAASATATGTGSTTSTVDPEAFYGYLFQVDKKPTRTLDALLRGIAGYISDNIGNKGEKALTPDKLACFYKAVGGNYDSLFVDVPNPSISWIYASIGCQHTLQPTLDDFQPPSIPALTTRGFVRWQSIEILLGPEEHVPFIQNAVRDFGIKHPDTGELFPGPVPKEAFPLVADPEIEKWHDQCAQELRKRATPTESTDSIPGEREVRPTMPPRPKVQATYAHVRPTRPTMRPATEYFPRARESVPSGAPPPPRPFFQHVHSATGQPVRPRLSRSPSHRARQFLAPEDNGGGPRMARARRRSFPENMNTSPVSSPPNTGFPEPVRSPMEEPHVRRHSHPRHARRGSVSSDASSSEDGGTPPSPMDTERRRRRRRDYTRPPEPDSPQVPPVGVRYSVPPQPPPGTTPIPPRDMSRDRERRRGRREEDESKTRSFPIPIDLNGKLSAPFLLGKRDRATHTARSSSRNNGNLRWKDLDGPDLWRSSGGSMEEDDRPPTSSGRRSGEYKRRERERDHRSGSGLGSERVRVHDRRSSHEDGARRSHSDRERDRGGGGDRGGPERERVVSGSDRRSFRDRDRDRDRERRYVSPVRGVDGRRYPAH